MYRYGFMFTGYLATGVCVLGLALVGGEFEAEGYRMARGLVTVGVVGGGIGLGYALARERRRLALNICWCVLTGCSAFFVWWHASEGTRAQALWTETDRHKVGTAENSPSGDTLASLEAKKRLAAAWLDVVKAEDRGLKNRAGWGPTNLQVVALGVAFGLFLLWMTARTRDDELLM